MAETEFARAERLSRELYFANEKLKTYDRMAASGVWVQTEEYSKLVELSKRKCSHGDYRMQGTTDCANCSGDCAGRTEYYVIGEGFCIECRHKKEKAGDE